MAKAEQLLRMIRTFNKMSVDNNLCNDDNFNVRGAVRDLRRHGHEVKIKFKNKKEWEVTYLGSPEKIDEGLEKIQKAKHDAGN